MKSSLVLDLGVRLVGPAAVLLAIYLFFAGHNRPGGGFAAGLVLGALVALRTLADRPLDLPIVPLVGAGGAVVAGVSIAPILFGSSLLDQAVWKADVAVLGTVKSGSALIFDLGVTMIVVGLVAAVLEGLADRPQDGGS